MGIAYCGGCGWYMAYPGGGVYCGGATVAPGVRALVIAAVPASLAAFVAALVASLARLLNI